MKNKCLKSQFRWKNDKNFFFQSVLAPEEVFFSIYNQKMQENEFFKLVKKIKNKFSKNEKRWKTNIWNHDFRPSPLTIVIDSNGL